MLKIIDFFELIESDFIQIISDEKNIPENFQEIKINVYSIYFYKWF